jgi:hypothetical protein
MDLTTIEEKQRVSGRLCGEFRHLALPVNSQTEIARILNRKLPQLSVTPHWCDLIHLTIVCMVNP